MNDCIRRNNFISEEKHKCFVIGCEGYCYPATAKTCEKCHFKICENGHCGCDLTEEAKFAIDILYETFCNFCFQENEIVVWKLNGVEVKHKPVRTPKLGWSTLTILEKLIDSAKTSLHIQEKKTNPNFSTVYRSLNKSLKILRAKISLEKKRTPQQLLHTCEFRETTKTRCNRFPTKYDKKTGKYLCEKHLKKRVDKK